MHEREATLHCILKHTHVTHVCTSGCCIAKSLDSYYVKGLGIRHSVHV